MNTNEFEIDDFEKMLRKQADSFLMQPSERVWRSIYNDLHPGSKWPSLAIALFMILTLFWIGNNNRNNTEIAQDVNEKTVTDNPQKTMLQNTVPILKNNPNRPQVPVTTTTNNSVSEVANKNVIAIKSSGKIEINSNESLSDQSIKDVLQTPESGFVNQNNTAENTIHQSNNNQPSASRTVTSEINDRMIIPENQSSSEALFQTESATTSKAPETTDWSPVKKHRLTWKYYFSPMVTGVVFGGVNLNKSSSTLAYTPISGHQMNITDRIGFVVGANMYYPLRDRISVISGLHVGHMGYNIFGRSSRPDVATLTLVDKSGDMYNKFYLSDVSNGKEGLRRDVTNYNWQISIPVGLKYDIVNGNKFKVGLMSSIEPFVVMGSKAYLLSGDAGSYVEDPTLIRKINMNANIGIITTLEGRKTVWEIGPDFRYQVLSTYDNSYPVKEHFVNYGLHIAVGKKN